MGSIGTTVRRKIRDSDVEALTSLLANTSAKLILPSDKDAYAAAIARWSMAASKPAGLVVQPSNPHEVGIVTKYCNDNNIELAVKGGGHSTAGASSTDGGLLLYLESLRKVSVEDWPSEPGQKVFRIGGGATWGDVDIEGEKYGIGTVGGTVADTGVGGLTLGGGYGWLSGKYGLSIDCLLEVEVVLADGSVKRASEKENADLFWAMSGAGQNFGVATEFVMRAYPTGDMWIGLIFFPSAPEIVEKVVKVMNDAYTPDEKGHTRFGGQSMGGLGFMSPPDAKGQILTFITLIWNGTEQSGKEAWQPLFDIGPIISTMAMQSYSFANKFLAPPPGLRSSMKGSAFKMPISTSFVMDVYKIYSTFYESDPDYGGSLLMYELYEPSATVASSKGSFANRGTHMNALICPIWTDESKDAACRQWARDLNERFKQELEKQNVDTGEGGGAGGVAPRGSKGAVLLYGNYDQYDERSKDIFGDNHDRLKTLKGQYDPGNMFCKLFGIQPA